MSMPSSSEEVAIRQGRSPDLSISSTTRRSSWESEPWWARAISTYAASSLRVRGRRLRRFVGVARRLLGGRQLLFGLVVRHLVQALGDPLGGAAVVDEDDGRGVLLDQLQEPRIDGGPDRALRRLVGLGLGQARVRALLALLDGGVGLGHVLDGDDDLEVEILRLRCVDDRALRASSRPGTGRPARAAAACADSPMRWIGSLPASCVSLSSRSRVSAMWAPRLEGATAWISSTISASTPVRISRAPELIIR